MEQDPDAAEMTYCVGPALQNDFYCVHCFHIQVCIWSWKGSRRWSQKPLYWCSSENWKPCTARDTRSYVTWRQRSTTVSILWISAVYACSQVSSPNITFLLFSWLFPAETTCCVFVPDFEDWYETCFLAPEEDLDVATERAAREVSLPSVYNRSTSATSNGEESLFQCCDSVVWGALCFPADLRKRILGGTFCPTTTALGPPTKPATERWQGWVLLSALLPRNNCLIHYRTWSECLFRT